jgi:release factor family 3
MDSLNHDYAAGLFNNPESPCVSLYQPTHRVHPDNEQDPIRFRNLVKELEQSLRRDYSTRDVRPLLEPFHKLVEDRAFWNCTLNGLAVLGARGFFRTYRLQRAVPELAIVADSFHLKPLLRILQSADNYQLLGLSRQKISFFEGNRDGLDEVELDPAVPRAPHEAPRGEAKEFHVSQWTSSAGVAGVHYSEGDKSDIIENDATRFFRAVDHAILEHYSRPSRLPLLLAALPENQSLFRQLSRNPFLVSEPIDFYPDDLAGDALRNAAWQVIEPHYLERLAGLIEMFGAAEARELGSDDLRQIARSAVAARVATLLVEADRQIPGRIDAATGEIQFAELAKPDVDDMLDDIAELVLKHGGQVVVVPKERMPVQTGAAAIYRF